MAEGDAMGVAPPTSPPATILVIEDEGSVARMLEATLQLEGYIPLVASTGEEGVSLASTESPHLILLDLLLPGMDGFQVLDHIRNAPRTAHIPVVVVTARHEPEHLLRAYDSHADDYVRKPFGKGELLARIDTQLRHAKVNGTSPLTGLPGGMRVEYAIEDRLRADSHWSILYLDLDQFKAYNDVYGFIRGNDMIRLLATIVSETTRDLGAPGDFTGHIGGDDFIVITTPDRVAALSQRMIARWDAESQALYDAVDRERGALLTTDRQGHPQRYPLVTISIGVVTNERRPVTTRGEVSSIAAEVKRAAKATAGSAWYVDQRGPTK